MYNPYFNNNAFSNYNSLYNPAAAAGMGYGQPQKQEIIRVNGEGGARTLAGRMSANSSSLALDESAPLLWLIQTDGAGYPTLTAYKIELYTPDTSVSSDLERRVQKLEEIINESNTFNVAELKRQSAQSDSINKKHAER